MTERLFLASLGVMEEAKAVLGVLHPLAGEKDLAEVVAPLMLWSLRPALKANASGTPNQGNTSNERGRSTAVDREGVQIRLLINRPEMALFA